MLNKRKPMTQRLPSLVVPDDMMTQLSEISEDEGLSLSEVVRQGLAFFLRQYVKELNDDAKNDNELSKESA